MKHTLLALSLILPAAARAQAPAFTAKAQADAYRGGMFGFILEGDADGKVTSFKVWVRGLKAADAPQGAILVANQHKKGTAPKSSHFRLKEGIGADGTTTWDLSAAFADKVKAEVYPEAFSPVSSFMVQVLTKGGEAIGVPLSAAWSDLPPLEDNAVKLE